MPWSQGWTASGTAQALGRDPHTIGRWVSRASTKHASGAEQKCTSREVIGQRKCSGQLFGRSITEAGWQKAGE